MVNLATVTRSPYADRGTTKSPNNDGCYFGLLSANCDILWVSFLQSLNFYDMSDSKIIPPLILIYIDKRQLWINSQIRRKNERGTYQVPEGLDELKQYLSGTSRS